MLAFQVKIVGDFCNLRCRYCRNKDFDQNSKTVMNQKTLLRLFDLFSKINQTKINVCWHGGEPLLVGLNFFNQIIAEENKLDHIEWDNSVQTNATLISREWARFFDKNKFNIGVSLDGSKTMHNRERINNGNRGTYAKAMKRSGYFKK